MRPAVWHVCDHGTPQCHSRALVHLAHLPRGHVRLKTVHARPADQPEHKVVDLPLEICAGRPPEQFLGSRSVYDSVELRGGRTGVKLLVPTF
jgi:hypothetical protein